MLFVVVSMKKVVRTKNRKPFKDIKSWVIDAFHLPNAT